MSCSLQISDDVMMRYFKLSNNQTKKVEKTHSPIIFRLRANYVIPFGVRHVTTALVIHCGGHLWSLTTSAAKQHNSLKIWKPKMTSAANLVVVSIISNSDKTMCILIHYYFNVPAITKLSKLYWKQRVWIYILSSHSRSKFAVMRVYYMCVCAILAKYLINH